MAKESAPTLAGAASLDALSAAIGPAGLDAKAPPPVHAWNPPFCGDIDMRIGRDGTWFYAGSPIGRPAMVRLFSSILRQDPDGVMLVTPVEKVRIQVEDAPFLAVELAVEPGPQPVLRFRTNVDEWLEVDAEHPLRFAPAESDGLKPYVHVRGGLEALVRRPLFLELAERGEVRVVDGVRMFGVVSKGLFFPMAEAASLDGLM